MLNLLHKKKYENIYSEDHNSKYTLHLEDISGVNMSLAEYTDLFVDFLRTFYSELYNYYVKLAWLRKNFSYKGKRIGHNGNSKYVHGVFVKYLRRIVGMDIQIITRGSHFSSVTSYFDEFYPGFELGNPFENPEFYKFPYKNISIEFLVSVAHMDERLVLLKEADEQKMTHAIFLDFITNHVKCENEGRKKDKYEIDFNSFKGVSFFVKNLERMAILEKKKLKRKK